jgi:hypothetical protein
MNTLAQTRFACASDRRLPRIAAAIAVTLILTACGGGGGNSGGGGGGGGGGPIDMAQRISAATATAQSANNLCAPIQPFYWEVGDKAGKLASGSMQSGGGAPIYDGATIMSIASASKWIYGAYVVQKRNGQLTADDIKFLTFHSGYTSFSGCLPSQSVDECVAYQQNGVHSNATDGRFSYGGGHMEKHASLNGLGALNNAGLAAEIQSQLGADIALAYSQPQLAGGIYTSANAYAVFLRKILSGTLLMNAALGTHAVCTNPTTCPPGEAVNTPVPTTESYHYSIGHWVEDDPVNGDGAFESAGAFGFYPWIDASKAWYGIVARKDDTETGNGFNSAQCGQLIRKAWVTGVAQ